MARQDPFERVLDALGEAMLDDARWPAASRSIDELCGSKGNFLICGDGATSEDIDIFFARFCLGGQRNAELERLYFDVYHSLDERVPRVRRLRHGKVVHVSALYTEEEKKTSAAYNEALPLSDAQDCLNVRLNGPKGSRIVWVAGDPVGKAGWSSARIGAIGRLLPHLRQYVRVRSALAEAQCLGASVAGLLENTRVGVLQLDRRGRIVETNDIAGDMLHRMDGLCDLAGELCASRPEDNARLKNLLAGALPRFGGRGVSGSMTVRRSQPQPGYALHVMPVTDREDDYRPRDAAALVLIVDPVVRARIGADVVEAVLGLTPAEAEIAVLLAQGRTPRQMAVTTGRRYNTVRTHLKHIFAKLGVSRQLEVAQAVIALSGLPSDRD